MHKKRFWIIWITLILAGSALAAEEKNPSDSKAVEDKSSAKDGSAATKQDVEEKPTFDIFEYEVVGNTVLDKWKIEESVYDYMGEKKTIDDVEKARSALEKTYHDAGYLTVSINIPQQEVNAGKVKLEVLEGKVERLRVTDSHYYSLGVIKERVGEFAEGSVPNFTVAQKQLATVNRGANRQVTPILRPGKSPGKVEVDLKVQDQLPLHGSVELNDRYSANTTHTRLNGSVRYENLWQLDHSIGLSFQMSPEDTNEVKVVSGTYVIPMLSGDYFAAYGVVSRSNIAAVGDVSVIGNGNILGARYIHPLPQLEGYYHTLTAGMDYKDFKESIVLLGADEDIKTPISYTMFNLGYDGTYQTGRSQTQVNLGLNFSVRALGNSEREFGLKRSEAKPNFAVLNMDVKHLQKLPKDWGLQARLGGQLASEPLISAEEFSVGGVDSVRGYTESNSLGDNGAFASLELRTPSFQKYFKDYLKDAYAYGFLDGGYARTLRPLPSQIASAHLLSTGLGMKLKAIKGMFANLDYAHALHDAGDVKNGDDRLHFRLGYEW